MVKIKIILSLILAILGYLLGIIAEANHYTETMLYMASCFLKVLCFLIAVPLAYSASKIIRKKSNIIGIPGLRFASWVMYVVAIAHFISFFIWTANGIPLPDGQITIDAAIFFIASMLMIAEAWNLYKSKD